MTKIKICGFTNSEDYNTAVRAGVDFTGFIFYEKSPRYVDKTIAGEIIGTGLENGHQKVGVFVNEDAGRVREIYEFAGLDIVQLHGDESPAYCRDLGLPFWKVIRVKDRNSLEKISLYDSGTFLLDTFSSHEYGGTGRSFDLESARWAIASGQRMIIAGGISADNIEAVLELSPYGVDIGSSIEERPGKKDLRKLRMLIEKIKGWKNDKE